MLNNFIYAKKKSLFETALNNGEVLDEAIVFIEDTKEIWNHGTYFDGSKVDLSKLEEAISKIKTDGDGLMYLNDKGEYKIPLIIVDSEEELNSITPEIGTRAVVRNIVEGYDNLNLAKILNGEETNIPADMSDALDKYAFKVTSVDTSILFPYLKDVEHTVYKLFTLLNNFEEFEIVTNLDGLSILRVSIDSFGTPLIIYDCDGLEFYWLDNHIVERIITIDNIMSITNLGQNAVSAFFLFSTALNVSIIANKEYADYYYTSKGWVLSDYITEQLFLTFLSSCIPTRVSQLENDSDYITKIEVAATYLPKGNYAVDDVVPDGVYAVDADGKLIDYNLADSTALGVALVAGEHKFMIAKEDATNNGSNYNLYYDYDKGDLSLTNYNTANGTNSNGSLGTKLSDDFTTWTEGALSDFNGKTNTQVIAASSSNAKDMCKVLETFNAGSDNQGHSDWYVPAAGQLALMYLAKTDINAALANIGGTAFESNYYWSSSEFDASGAWGVRFANGGVSLSNKSSGSRVRFVRDISLSKPLKERVSDLESNKQDKLVSGTNIKTINNQSVLGSGNITISGGGSSEPYVLDIPSLVSSLGGESDDMGNVQCSGTVTSQKMSEIITAANNNNLVIKNECFQYHNYDIQNRFDEDNEIVDINVNGNPFINEVGYTPYSEIISISLNVTTSEAYLSYSISPTSGKFILYEDDASFLILMPNTYHIVTEESPTDIYVYLLFSIIPHFMEEYFVEFTTSSSGTTVSLPSTIKWADGEIPIFEPSTTYQISIVNNLGVVQKFK